MKGIKFFNLFFDNFIHVDNIFTLSLIYYLYNIIYYPLIKFSYTHLYLVNPEGKI